MSGFIPVGQMRLIDGRASYDSFLLGTCADAVRACATPEQQEFNRNHTTCTDCNGRGYYVYRGKDGRLIRETVGCKLCHGIGVLAKPRSGLDERAAVQLDVQRAGNAEAV